MNQEMILMLLLGIAIGLLLQIAIDAFNSVGFWRPFWDAYYWLKDKVTK